MHRLVGTEREEKTDLMGLHIIQSDAGTLAIASELTDSDAPELARALEGLKGLGGVPTVDLSAVSRISPRCIGALVAAWVDLAAADRWFEFRASDALWQRLGAAGVARIFFHRPASAAGDPADTPEGFRRGGALTPKAPAGARDDAGLSAETDRYLERIAALEEELVRARERENAAVSRQNDLGMELRGRSEEIAQLRSEIARGRGIAGDLEAARQRAADLAGELEDARTSIAELRDAAAKNKLPAKKRPAAKGSPSAGKRSGSKKPAKSRKPGARKAVREKTSKKKVAKRKAAKK